MNSTVGHTGIYACGDRVKLKLSQQCSGRRNKNPTTLVVWSVNLQILTACYVALEYRRILYWQTVR